MTSFFQGTQANLADGPSNVYWALGSVTIPTNIDDVVAMVDPYATKTGWNFFGFTDDGTEYERSMTSQEYEVEQQTTAVLEKVTSVKRTLQVTLAEYTPENLKILEEGGAIATIAAATNKGAQKAVSAGNIENLTRYRMAVLGEADMGFGKTVIEPGVGAKKRGPIYGFVAYQAALDAERSRIIYKKGKLVSAQCQFQLFPDPAVTNTQENTIKHLIEQAGTIA